MEVLLFQWCEAVTEGGGPPGHKGYGPLEIMEFNNKKQQIWIREEHMENNRKGFA